ncbi:hypothetical protein ACJ2A9_16520 [Anaerobacillus sp. MEB173]
MKERAKQQRKKKREVIKELLKKKLTNWNRQPARNPASQTKTTA